MTPKKDLPAKTNIKGGKIAANDHFTLVRVQRQRSETCRPWGP